MSRDKKVTPIKYKQLDNDPKIKQVTNEMEKHLLGEQGVGLLDALGLTPGRTQKLLDDEFERNVETVMEKHKDYIVIERTKRAVEAMEIWIRENNGSSMVIEQFEKEGKKAELDIIRELMEKEGFL